jgi:hypothetical protein
MASGYWEIQNINRDRVIERGQPNRPDAHGTTAVYMVPVPLVFSDPFIVPVPCLRPWRLARFQCPAVPVPCIVPVVLALLVRMSALEEPVWLIAPPAVPLIDPLAWLVPVFVPVWATASDVTITASVARIAMRFIITSSLD